MNKREFNNLEMFKTVDSLFTNQQEIWSGFTPLAQVFSNFKVILDKLLNQSLLQQRSDTSGHTSQKNERKEELAELTYSISVKMRAFAKLTKDKVLIKAVDCSVWSMLKSSEAVFINQCQIIHSEGMNNLTNLSGYNLNDADLVKLKAAIDAYVPLASARNNVGDISVRATRNLSELFSLASDELDTLDDMVEGLISNADFRKDYLEARKITDRRGPGAKPVEVAETV